MTAVLKKESKESKEPAAEDATAPPGWEFAANLTPPELVIGARIRRLRERFLLALCLVVLLAASGYAYGFYRTHEAAWALLAEQTRTDLLRKQQSKYAALVSLQDSVASVRGQIATLMGSDVDVNALVDAIAKARPAGVSITQLSVNFGSLDKAAAGSGQSLDTSGKKHIGSIELQATGSKIDDASMYAAALKRIPGVVDVFPTDNRAQQNTTQFTITVNVTEDLLSHRFQTKGTR
jgi:hypothetical protein